MRDEKCSLVLKGESDSKAPMCYYCGLSIAPGEEVVNRDQKLYHRNCFRQLFTLTSKCLTCEKAAKCFKQENETLT
jgi:hypothetical protein